ncbi:glycosyltransferase family 2 protein [Hyphobacterium sp. CCMP332]|uniref:glycosyltransferase family 2 protein n=1 Tax=Hyphobacterium sp. CCMP332 TaxID=2749086 RepID=UPI0016506B04|nr:glycosyltransferase family 2 protein [Hyphobacterium sp. CCMP332]QNL17926.1 glycosyltransferase family 2 protein [Hyphobacterium sp. CCMP332]
MQAGTLSIVIPVHNEAGNIDSVMAEAVDVFSAAFEAFHIIAVEDGSTDATWEKLTALGARYPHVTAIQHPNRAGKSAALRTGFLAAKTLWVATMDGDGQDDPQSVVDMASKIDLASLDAPALVCGCRTNRTDGANRKWASKIGNAIRRFMLRDDCPDTACGLKVIPRDLFLALPFFDSLHRYLPPLTRYLGFDQIYVDVVNRARISGETKYTNVGRAFAGFFDLMGVNWLMRRTHIPSKALLFAPKDDA